VLIGLSRIRSGMAETLVVGDVPDCTRKTNVYIFKTKTSSKARRVDL